MTQAIQAITNKSLLALAIPIMLANVSEPLIGVVNTAVIGRLHDAALIGGVGIGSVIFGFLFWGFGFLRMSTSGLAAQATGAGDQTELAALFWRSLVLAFCLGLAMLLLSPFIGPLAVSLMGGSPAVQSAAAEYFSWRVLAAPAALANFAILGWFIGQGRTAMALGVQLFLNVSNMVLSSLLVLQMGWAVSGVGVASVVAEYAAFIVGLICVLIQMRVLQQTFAMNSILAFEKFKALVTANADIMIRTMLLLFAFAWFARRGATMGDQIVAANIILLHFFEVAAYLTDGFANAAEALVGQSIGAKDRPRYKHAIRLSTIWGMGFGSMIGILIFLLGPQLIALMTSDPRLVALATEYLIWAAVLPVIGAACFLFDGIFTGAMATKELRNMMVISTALFMASWAMLEPAFGNHGLWAAMCVFMLARGVSFAMCLPLIERRVFSLPRVS